MAASTRAPLWLPPAIAAIRRLPFGRYWLLHRLRRFVRRSFVARLAPDLGRFQFHCDLRDSVAAEACFTGWYEPQETRVCAHVLRPGSVFMDVGANWGYFSLVAAGLVGAAGRVVALEPEPRLFERLSSNVAMNGLRIVRPLQLAAGAGPGSLAFKSFDAEGGNWGTSHGVAATAAADFHCATAALDDVLDTEGVDGVQLIKIDVEGGEVGVLAGMHRGLARGRYRYVLLECHPELLASRGIDARVCVDRLTEAGYRIWLIDHSARMHESAVRSRVQLREMMRRYSREETLPTWPHLLAAAPGAPDPH